MALGTGINTSHYACGFAFSGSIADSVLVRMTSGFEAVIGCFCVRIVLKLIGVSYRFLKVHKCHFALGPTAETKSRRRRTTTVPSRGFLWQNFKKSSLYWEANWEA